MGMFDDFYIPLSILPLTEDQKSQLDANGFQTKSFDNILGSVQITDDRNLILYGVPQPDFNGPVWFYADGKDKVWYEFECYFRDGKMIAIGRCMNLLTLLSIENPF